MEEDFSVKTSGAIPTISRISSYFYHCPIRKKPLSDKRISTTWCEVSPTDDWIGVLHNLIKQQNSVVSSVGSTTEFHFHYNTERTTI